MPLEFFMCVHTNKHAHTQHTHTQHTHSLFHSSLPLQHQACTKRITSKYTMATKTYAMVIKKMHTHTYKTKPKSHAGRVCSRWWKTTMADNSRWWGIMGGAGGWQAGREIRWMLALLIKKHDPHPHEPRGKHKGKKRWCVKCATQTQWAKTINSFSPGSVRYSCNSFSCTAQLG